jgi:putative spermidine/putrescine transport system permease protein
MSTHRGRRYLYAEPLRLAILLFPLGVLYFVVFLIPLARLVPMSFSTDQGPSLVHYALIAKEPLYRLVLLNTFRMATVVTVICLVLGYPTAYVLAAARGGAARWLLILVLLPFWTSVLVRTYAWMVLLGRGGLVNQGLLAAGLLDAPLKLMHNAVGVYVGMVHVLLPFMILPLFSVMKGIEPSLLSAAANLGASTTQALVRVYLPLTLPGVGAGCLLVFILALGFYITPALMGGPADTMVSMLIQMQVQSFLNWGAGSALAVLLLVTTLLLATVYNRLVGIESVWER